MGAAPPSYEPQRRRTLRFSIGVTAAFALTQIVPWPINFVTAVLPAVLLQDAKPTPFGKGVLATLAAVASIWTSLALSLVLLAYPAVLVLTFFLLLATVYWLVLSGTVPKIVFVGTLISVTVIPVVTKLLPELAYVAALSFTASFILGWLITTLAFALMPPPEEVPTGHGHDDVGDVKLASINMALVAGTMLAIFLAFGRTDIVTMIYAALFALSLSTAGANAMGLSYIRATLIYGGIATLVIFEILVMAPFLTLAIALFFLAIYIFGFNLFSHNPTAGEWGSGSTAFIILLSGLLASEKVSASVKVIDRLVQIGTAALFVAFAFALFEYLRRLFAQTTATDRHA